MNTVCAHCIAKVNGKVVGYALCMDKRFKNKIDVLRSMFVEIDSSLVHYPKKYTNYIAMGQICIDKEYRKKGIFRGLYNYMREELRAQYSCVITEVDAKNVRSSDAHKAIGFELLKTYFSDAITWELMLLDF
jgi:ribosomal protein S18 acetylase RimI-like enzyme